jgi:hypothetical protein
VLLILKFDRSEGTLVEFLLLLRLTATLTQSVTREMLYGHVVFRQPIRNIFAPVVCVSSICFVNPDGTRRAL